jgi:branched-chain amino acid transport system permease protein
MEIVLVSLLNGLVYGMLLFMLASGLTLIFSMMGVLNFAHASIYMIGAYLAFTVSQVAGFFPALIIAPLLCALLGAAIEVFVQRGVQMIWGMLPMAYRVPPSLDFPLFTFYGANFPAYRGFMLLVSAGMLLALWLLLKKTRIGLIIQAALSHPQMASALGHNVPRVFTTVFAGGCMLAGLAGVIGGNYQTTEPGMADAMGPIVFVVVVFGGLGSLSGCFIASILMGMIQTFAVVIDASLLDMLRPLGVSLSGDNLFTEIMAMPVARIGALLPFAMMILILLFRPRGLLGTRDT